MQFLSSSCAVTEGPCCMLPSVKVTGRTRFPEIEISNDGLTCLTKFASISFIFHRFMFHHGLPTACRRGIYASSAELCMAVRCLCFRRGIYAAPAELCLAVRCLPCFLPFRWCSMQPLGQHNGSLSRLTRSVKSRRHCRTKHGTNRRAELPNSAGLPVLHVPGGGMPRPSYREVDPGLLGIAEYAGIPWLGCAGH